MRPYCSRAELPIQERQPREVQKAGGIPHRSVEGAGLSDGNGEVVGASVGCSEAGAAEGQVAKALLHLVPEARRSGAAQAHAGCKVKSSSVALPLPPYIIWH